MNVHGNAANLESPQQPSIADRDSADLEPQQLARQGMSELVRHDRNRPDEKYAKEPWQRWSCIDPMAGSAADMRGILGQPPAGAQRNQSLI